mgnify:CR=1 FL=1
MRYTYALLAVVFMLLAWLIVQRLHFRASQGIFITTTFCYLMMVGFNTYLTTLPIVRYDWNKVLGAKMISWPIEDLAYLVVGLYMAQALYAYWLTYYENNQKTTSKADAKRRSGTKHRP